MRGGVFLTLEGIEGAGKSTVAKLVCAWLESRGVRVRATREPGGTPLAERVREIVLGGAAEPLSPVAETLLMFAARALHVESLIAPALACGEWVVCDRFTDATRAYQGSGRGVDAALIDALARAVHAHVMPDCTLLLDLPVTVGLSRARARRAASAGRSNADCSNGDRFETESVAFFERVRAGYLALARAEPQRFRVIDAAAPLDEVERRVGEILTELHGGRA